MLGLDHFGRFILACQLMHSSVTQFKYLKVAATKKKVNLRVLHLLDMLNRGVNFIQLPVQASFHRYLLPRQREQGRKYTHTNKSTLKKANSCQNQDQFKVRLTFIVIRSLNLYTPNEDCSDLCCWVETELRGSWRRAAAERNIGLVKAGEPDFFGMDRTEPNFSEWEPNPFFRNGANPILVYIFVRKIF